MTTTDINGIVAARAKGWLTEGMDNVQIEDELIQMGIEPRHIPELMAEINKMRQSKKATGGLGLILAGALLCLSGCVLTIVLSDGGINGAVLYGFTSIGLLMIFAGLVNIFR